MNKILTFCIVFVAFAAQAQKYAIQGRVVDSLSTPLPSATIVVLSSADSSLVNFGSCGTDGRFEIRNLASDTYLLKISFLGFKSFTQQLKRPKGNILDVGVVSLQPVSSELEAVEVAAERLPVVLKKDTIEFNATSFKTKPNASVEELLKKLPGIEVDNTGKITSQGEEVKRVTVDGKNFFGADPTLATRNLPADAVEKVQLFDKKSDQTTFSGIDDGQREKTINLSLKEEKRKGAFGNLMGGAGTDSRFEGRASINRFTKTKQLSILSLANNINQQGFSMEEYMNFSGNSKQMMSGGAVRISIDNDNNDEYPWTLETVQRESCLLMPEVSM